MGRTLWEQGPDGVRRGEGPGTPQSPSETDGTSAEASTTATTTAVVAETVPAAEKASAAAPPGDVGTPPPQPTIAGGTSLAARLIQNRTKTGPQKVLEAGGGTPSPARTRLPSGSFDLLEVTAVGGPQAADLASSRAGAAQAATEAPARTSHPTPGGGLPGLLARTQLGLGDAIRSFRESAALAQATPPTTDGPAAAAAVTPAPVGVAARASVEPPASGGETAAVVAADAAAGAAAVSGPVSGPVFELATGPVTASGPVFDILSGPLSGPTTTVSAQVPAAAATAPAAEQAAPRQTWSTPASGRLAALLAESRKRTGRHETLDKSGEPPPAVAAPAEAAPNPAPGSFASGSGPTSQDVATMRVPGAAVAQDKGAGFAATLLGVPAPELTPPVAWTGGDASGAATLAGRARHLRDRSLQGNADRNTPSPVEGEATERSLLSSGDLRARWNRNSDEQKRTTDIIDIVRPTRRGIRTAALILGGAAVVVVILVAVAQMNRSGGEEKAVTNAPVPSLAPALRVHEPTPAAAAVAPGEAPAGEAPVGEPRVGEAPVGETAKEEAKAAAAMEAKPAAAEGDDVPAQALPSTFRAADTSAAALARDDGGEPKRKVTRSETRRSDARHAEPKTRRRSAEGRSARAQGTSPSASHETAVAPPRPRVGQSLRGSDADPDGTLPLGTP